MKKILLFVFLLCSVSVSAQQLKVKVVSSGAPMGFAYVYVNGEVILSADSLGVAHIPYEKLALGDSVSASFVGAGYASALYDEAVRESGELWIDLPGDFNMEEISVYTDDLSQAYFRRYVNRRRNSHYYDDFVAHFVATSSTGQKTIGELSLANLPQSYVEQTGEKPLRIRPEIDGVDYPDGMKSALQLFFAIGVQVGGLHSAYIYNRDMTVKYMGKQANQHRFFVTRTALWTAMDGYQAMLYIDEHSKELVSAVGDVFWRRGERIEFNADYQLDSNLIYPLRINGSVIDAEGVRWDMEITDIYRTKYERTRSRRR